MIVRSQKPTLATLLFSVRGTIVPVIWKKVLFTVIVSSLVVLSHGYAFDYGMALTATPFTLWGLTLAIFLAFRNTTAYQRFWEARTLWGDLLIVSRNMARQVTSFMPLLDRQERLRLSQQLISFAYSLKDQLREQEMSENLVQLAGPTPVRTDVRLSQFAANLLKTAKQQNVSDMLQAQLDEQLSRLSAIQGGCERIKSTPIPYSYILMLHRTVHIYCFLLPFCLVDSIGWFTPFAVCILAYTFFGLDALGDQIADPFDTEDNDLPLNTLCRTIEISVLSILDEPAPEPLKPVNDVLL